MVVRICEWFCYFAGVLAAVWGFVLRRAGGSGTSLQVIRSSFIGFQVRNATSKKYLYVCCVLWYGKAIRT